MRHSAAMTSALLHTAHVDAVVVVVVVVGDAP